MHACAHKLDHVKASKFQSAGGLSSDPNFACLRFNQEYGIRNTANDNLLLAPPTKHNLGRITTRSEGEAQREKESEGQLEGCGKKSEECR